MASAEPSPPRRRSKPDYENTFGSLGLIRSHLAACSHQPRRQRSHYPTGCLRRRRSRCLRRLPSSAIIIAAATMAPAARSAAALPAAWPAEPLATASIISVARFTPPKRRRPHRHRRAVPGAPAPAIPRHRRPHTPSRRRLVRGLLGHAAFTSRRLRGSALGPP
jgi:hypothetical protein